MTIVSPTFVALAWAFLSVAAVVGVLAIGVVARTVLDNRSTRLARRQSMRTYYGRLVLSH